MPKFVTTHELKNEVLSLIATAWRELLLVTPYLKFSSEVRERLVERERMKRDTDLLCRRGKSFDRHLPQLKGLSHVNVRFLQTLHAKCYVNEETAVLGSMNLHAYSEENNDEMGLVVRRRDEAALFESVRAEARRLMGMGERETSARVVRSSKDGVPSHAGFCIRCGEDIPLNAEKPLCLEDFRRWARYEDEDYAEDFCHRCGESRETSFRKPLCRSCYRDT